MPSCEDMAISVKLCLVSSLLSVCKLTLVVFVKVGLGCRDATCLSRRYFPVINTHFTYASQNERKHLHVLGNKEKEVKMIL